MDVELLKMLAADPLFEGVSAQQIEDMSTFSQEVGKLHLRLKRYKKGAAVCSAGEVISSFGLVKSGRIIIERAGFGGESALIGTAGAGQLFAEVYACSRQPMMVTARAEGECEVLHIGLESLFACRREGAERVLKNLLRITAAKNLALTRKISCITPRTIRGRLAEYLLYMYSLHGSAFDVPFSRAQLADYLNVDRSALSAELGRLKKEGLIDCCKSSFVLSPEFINGAV